MLPWLRTWPYLRAAKTSFTLNEQVIKLCKNKIVLTWVNADFSTMLIANANLFWFFTRLVVIAKRIPCAVHLEHACGKSRPAFVPSSLVRLKAFVHSSDCCKKKKMNTKNGRNQRLRRSSCFLCCIIHCCLLRKTGQKSPIQILPVLPLMKIVKKHTIFSKFHMAVAESPSRRTSSRRVKVVQVGHKIWLAD